MVAPTYRGRVSVARSCRLCSHGSRPWQVALCGAQGPTARRRPGRSARPLRHRGRDQFAGLLQSVLLLRPLGIQLANLAGAVVSSVLANELHRRLTFHAEGRIGWWTAQWEGGGLAAAGLVATATALALLEPVVSDAWSAQVLLIAAVTGAVGSVRFVVLRLWVFSTHARRTTTRPEPEPA